MPADLDRAWDDVRTELRDAVSDFTFHVWLEPLRLVRRTGDELFLSAPDHIRAWVSERYASLIEAAAERALGEPAAVVVVDEAWEPRPGAAAPRHEVASAEPSDALNPRYTFEQFVICDGNRFAHAAALAVAELPAQAYNPLFIHGDPGLGKTHLLHAIGNYVRRYGAGLTVCYATAETFTSAFVEAVRAGGQGGAIEAFKRRFRGADVLLIDDIQFLAAKARTREELFHTFNALYEAGKQLVFASDRPPSDLADLELRLRERFECGLVATMEPPDLPARLAILRMRVARDELDGIEDASLSEIARCTSGSVRLLEGALIKVVAAASLRSEPPSPAVVAGVLRTRGASPARLTLEAVQDATAGYFSLCRERLVARDRRPDAARPRQIAMYLARELTAESLPAIGRAFQRDHATVLHACRAVAREMERDPTVYKAVQELRNQLTSPA